MKQDPGPEGEPEEGTIKGDANDKSFIDGKPIDEGKPVIPPVGKVETTGDPVGTTPIEGVIKDITAPGTIAEGVIDGENGATPTVILVGTADDPEVVPEDILNSVREGSLPPIPEVAEPLVPVPVPPIPEVAAPVVPMVVPAAPIVVVGWNDVVVEN